MMMQDHTATFQRPSGAQSAALLLLLSRL